MGLPSISFTYIFWLSLYFFLASLFSCSKQTIFRRVNTPVDKETIHASITNKNQSFTSLGLGAVSGVVTQRFSHCVTACCVTAEVTHTPKERTTWMCRPFSYLRSVVRPLTNQNQDIFFLQIRSKIQTASDLTS